MHISTYLEKQDCLTLIQCCRPLHALGSFRKPLSEWRWRWRRSTSRRSVRCCTRGAGVRPSRRGSSARTDGMPKSSLASRRGGSSTAGRCRAASTPTRRRPTRTCSISLRRRTKVVKLIRAWASRQGIPPADLSLFLRGRPIFKGDRGEEQCVPEDAIWKEEYNEAAKALAGLDELADVIDLPPTLRLLWAPSRGGFPFYMADGDVLQLCVDTHHIEMPDDNSDATEGPVEEVN